MIEGSSRSSILALAIVAALTIVPGLVAAQTPGTVVLDFHIHAGPVTLSPGPLAVPDPWVPNPVFEAQATTAGTAPDGLPVEVIDAPGGLVLLSPAGATTVLGYSKGVEQKHVAPVEFAGNTLTTNLVGLPLGLGVDGCTCPSPAGYFVTSPAPSVLQLPINLLAPAGGVSGSAPPAVDQPLAFAATASEPAKSVDAQYALPPADVPAPEEAAGQLAPVDATPAAPLIAVALAAAGLVLLKLLLPLYHRFKKKTALDNDTRKGLYELLRAAPGASAAELSQGSGLHVTTVKYHLDVLRKVGMVGEQVIDGCRRFYSYENGDRVEFLSRALLDEPAAKAIYNQIAQHPGLPFIEVARSLGMRKEHVHYHVKKLTKHGLLSDRWEGGRRLLFTAVPTTHAAPMQPASPAMAASAPSARAPLPAVAMPMLAVMPGLQPEVKG